MTLKTFHGYGPGTLSPDSLLKFLHRSGTNGSGRRNIAIVYVSGFSRAMISNTFRIRSIRRVALIHIVDLLTLSIGKVLRRLVAESYSIHSG